ncbi:MAG: hypothetical protein HYV77_04090, partial [Candidatus Wildermuthbacteria bacterium]|nr:hypothetical protein [Candidatus Wildermuthbacteria bacterium]
MFGFLFSNHNREFRVQRSYAELEPQEVLLDKFVRDQEGESYHEKKIEVPLSQKLLRVLFAGFILAAAGFLAQSAIFQVVDHNKMVAAAKNNLVRSAPILAERGVIYDRNGTQLAFNRPGFDLICDRRDFPIERIKRGEQLLLIARIIGRDIKELEETFEKDQTPKFIAKENLDHEQLVMWEANKSQVAGCKLQQSVIREYAGIEFSHLLGYTAKMTAQELQTRSDYFVGENIGKIGIEKTYEDILRGKPGEIFVEKDSRGETIGEERIEEQEPGKSIVLSIDAGLQGKLARSLQGVFVKTGTKKGVAIAMDPRDGKVIALVSMPGFDNNLFSQGIDQKDWKVLLDDPLKPMFNRALAGAYPTGSVIKPIVGLAALQEGIITARTVIYAPLELCVKNKYTGQDECFRDWSFHGDSDIKRAIAESVNTFFYIVGGGHEDFKGLGPQRIKEYIQKFGWGEKTGIDLPGEVAGQLPSFDSNWRLGNTYHFSIGQGPFAITPLQVVNAFAAVANGGTLYQPHVADKIIDKDKKAVYEF